MKTFRAASLMLIGVLIVAISVDMSAKPRFGVDVVHSFGGAADGANPYTSLLQAADGNFYGTTSAGGASNLGTVFKMTQTGAVTILHSFTGGADGSSPLAPVIQATDGNFYGTAYAGGASNLGTVFKVTPAGAFTLIYTFAGGMDGANPRAALLQAQDGNFYGTTQFGGNSQRGTLFAMNMTGAILSRYMFTGGIDGAYPYAPVIQATDGTLYGTNYGGTVSTFGRIFKLVPGGTVTVVHTFAGGSTDGTNPAAALVLANDGNFYGTTLFGGADNNGTAFKMTPSGTVTILNSFTGGSDGANPGAALIQASDGNLYGTTKVNTTGPTSYGTIFKLSLAGTLTVVHTFTGGDDGSVSNAALIQATSGKLYGTTTFGGDSGMGVVFRLPAGVRGDFDGDGKTDITVFRPSTGAWMVLESSTNFTTSATYMWGTSTDKPATADYDGDGVADVAVFRPSTGAWWILESSKNFTTSMVVTWGTSGDVPVPGDYDGDGKADLAVYRPSTGTWWILESSSNFTTYMTISWGTSADVPVPGDYDGDGMMDPAIYRPSTGTWWILHSSTNYTTFISQAWGNSTDIPVPSDYDGDGKMDLAVFRPSTSTWWVLESSTNYTSYMSTQWGVSSDVLVPADYDGDGKTDLAIFRPSTGDWWILLSTNSTVANYAWGVSTDVPVLKRP